MTVSGNRFSAQLGGSRKSTQELRKPELSGLCGPPMSMFILINYDEVLSSSLATLL